MMYDRECGAIVTGCPDAKAETCPSHTLLSHPFHFAKLITDEWKSGLSSFSLAFKIEYVIRPSGNNQ
jgi:hypothetical protein